MGGIVLLASSASEAEASSILLHPVKRRIIISYIFLSAVYPPIAQFSIIKNLPAVSHLMKYNHSDHICVTRDDLFVDEKKRKGAVARFFVQQPLFALGVFNEPLARGKRNKAKRKEQLGESAAALFSLNCRGAGFPSPYGDMVLKLGASPTNLYPSTCFRPLTGIWF